MFLRQESSEALIHAPADASACPRGATRARITSDEMLMRRDRRRGSAVRLRRKEARLASRTRALRSDSDRRGQLVRPPLSRTPRSQWRDLRHGEDDGSSSYPTVRNLVARHQYFQWQNSG